MKPKSDLVQRAERAARKTIKDWIRRALRETFIQALGQAWSIRHNEVSANSRDFPPSLTIKDYEDVKVRTEIQVEMSASGLNACFTLVDRVSRAWQTKLKEERHERVARWVADVHQQGKSTLWAELQMDDNYSNSGSDSDSDSGSEQLNADIDNEQLLKNKPEISPPRPEAESQGMQRTKRDDATQEARIDIQIGAHDDCDEEESSSNSDNDLEHPNVYCKLRELGRRRNVDSPVLSIPEALHEIKEFTFHHPTYWPLDNDIIDQACLDMSHRMRARDKHGSGGTGNAGDGSKSFTKKTVRFKVLPKSVWETKQQERNRKQEAESSKDTTNEDEYSVIDAIRTSAASTEDSKVETMILASMKRKKRDVKSYNMSQVSQKKQRVSKQQETSRVPFDFHGKIERELSLEEKKVLDGLLILDLEVQDNKGARSEKTIPEVPLGLFGGLQHVGKINHTIQNPGAAVTRDFMSRDADKMTRRKEKASIQERVDPNRLRIGRAENPETQKSKILRTEGWFDDRKKFLDFDLGWSLLEIKSGRNQKRLCAFSSMEVCLEDRDR